jgi:Holliday junction resolvasome RuvABC DNA-binding subunit
MKVPIRLWVPERYRSSQESKEKECGDDLISLVTVDEKKAATLKGAGFDTYVKIANASVAQLKALDGIGKAGAEKIIAHAAELSGGAENASGKQGLEQEHEGTPGDEEGTEGGAAPSSEISGGGDTEESEV